MAASIGDAPQEAATPCLPLTHKSMEGQIFLEPAWQGSDDTFLVNCLTGERARLPPKNPNDQWSLVGRGMPGSYFN